MVSVHLCRIPRSRAVDTLSNEWVNLLANKHIWTLSRWVLLSVDTIDLSCSVRPRNHEPRRLASTFNLDRPFEPWWLAVPIYQLWSYVGQANV